MKYVWLHIRQNDEKMMRKKIDIIEEVWYRRLWQRFINYLNT